MIQIRRTACIKSGKILGISTFEFLDFPDMQLDSIPQLEINKKLEKIIKQLNPKIVYTTPPNDLNLDHQKVFESTLVATRPMLSKVRRILCYELPGYKKTQFNPSTYVDISKEFVYKIKAFHCYKSEIKKFPHPRSIESIENLSKLRGIESGLKHAESFSLIREVE